jgi:hypothetical protein
MVEVSAVDLYEVSIVTKEVTYVAHFFVLCFDKVGNPFFDLQLTPKVKFNILG